MHPLLLIAFVLSGISSLTLEIIWTRHLEHVFGATTLAISTVLTCFMGGLALGSWLFGRYADKLKAPAVGYAVAEGIVGLSALFIPTIIQVFFPVINLWMTDRFANNFMLYSMVRFAAVAVLLLIPTTCMGATLPLLSRHIVSSERHMKRVSERVGLLYTINTIGAIAGVFLATFVLLRTIGLAATNYTAATINLVLAVLIVVFRHRIVFRESPEEKALKDELDAVLDTAPTPAFEATPAARGFVLAAFFLSGLASMNLQVVWNRAMAMIIGSSVYSFAIVLIAFLIGLAGGSAAFNRLSRRVANPLLVLAFVELGIAAAAMLSYIYIDDLPQLFARMVTTNIVAYEDHVGLVQFLMFTVAAMAVLPVTFGMGATFPLTIRLLSNHFQSVGRDVGRVYAVNTAGSIAGSFLSAFVFVPLFSRHFSGAGMQISYYLSTFLYVFIGLGMIWAHAGFRLPRKALMTLPVGALSALFFFGVPSWDPAAMTLGVFRISLMKNALDEEAWGDPDIRYYYDGVTTTVSVEMWGRHFALKNNGKVDASNGDDMPTQIMVAAYPLLFHPQGPDDLDVAIIGFGSGVTVGSALQFPVKHVDCIELEAAVVAASRVFGRMEDSPVDPEFDVNHLVYRREDSPLFRHSDPNTYVINERLALYANDGRNFLATRPGRYDVIISEPSNPWITGVANMFTRESFASSSLALKEGGIFAQWVQLYELSPANIRTIFRTFADVYPYVMLFTAEDLSSDTVLLGSFSPIELDRARLAALFDDPRIRDELSRAYIFQETDVLARILLVDRDEVDAYTSVTADGERFLDLREQVINTDDNAIIEFSAPHDLISFRKFQGYLATIYSETWEYARLHGALQGFDDSPDGAQHRARMALSLLANGRKREARTFATASLLLAPTDPSVQLADEAVSLLEGRTRPDAPALHAPLYAPSMTEALRAELADTVGQIHRALDKQAHRHAYKLFMNMPEQLWRNGGAPMLHLKGYLHFLHGDPADSSECEDAIEALTTLVREDESFALLHPEVFYWLGLCHDNALNFDKAVKNIRLYVESLSRQRRNAQIATALLEAALTAEDADAEDADAEDVDAEHADAEDAAPRNPQPLRADPPDFPTTDGPGETPKR
ncbi:MAG: fused MFS/spermidine synthase [Proteobacteria bacterium]|nr:fused MFS/spermidine synthase [Pseudomonadota bacterium]